MYNNNTINNNSRVPSSNTPTPPPHCRDNSVTLRSTLHRGMSTPGWDKARERCCAACMYMHVCKCIHIYAKNRQYIDHINVSVRRNTRTCEKCVENGMCAFGAGCTANALFASIFLRHTCTKAYILHSITSMLFFPHTCTQYTYAHSTNAWLYLFPLFLANAALKESNCHKLTVWMDVRKGRGIRRLCGGCT